MRRDYAPQLRCPECGWPHRDHVAIHHAVRARLLHLLPARIRRWLRPLRR